MFKIEIFGFEIYFKIENSYLLSETVIFGLSNLTSNQKVKNLTFLFV